MPRGKPVRGAVDRNRAGELGYVGLVFDELVFRMGQLEAATVRGDSPRKAGDDAGSQALGVEFERARAFAEKGQIELVHAVGDADREDVASPRVHRPHSRVRHSGHYGGRLALADVGQRHELAAMGQSEGGVAQKVAHGAKFEFRQGSGCAPSQCAL